MTQANARGIGHNQCPEDWRDDASCAELMTSLLNLQDQPFLMEAAHLGYLQVFGDSYRNSDFASLVRRKIYDATGRECQ
jgi:hypothetical protein